MVGVLCGFLGRVLLVFFLVVQFFPLQFLDANFLNHFPFLRNSRSDKFSPSFL